jgi:hypothetical protein
MPKNNSGYIRLLIPILVLLFGVAIVFTYPKLAENFSKKDSSPVTSPTPDVPVVKGTSNNQFLFGFNSMSQVTSLSQMEDWRNWYPVYRNHTEGQLVGDSYNIPNNPQGFPSTYKGGSVDYYLYGITGNYWELLAHSSNYKSLDAWERNSNVYYNTAPGVPNSLGSYDNCKDAVIPTLNLDLASPALKKPLEFYLPSQKNKYAMGPVICSIQFDDGDNGKKRYQIPRLSQQKKDKLYKNPFQWHASMNFFVITALRDSYVDSWGTNIKFATNLYMSSEKTPGTITVGNRFCNNQTTSQNDTFKCTVIDAQNNKVISYWHPTANRFFYVDMVEEYTMRAVRSALSINNRNIYNLYGGGCVWFDGNPLDPYKQCDTTTASGAYAHPGSDPYILQGNYLYQCGNSTHGSGSDWQYTYKNSTCTQLSTVTNTMDGVVITGNAQQPQSQSGVTPNLVVYAKTAYLGGSGGNENRTTSLYVQNARTGVVYGHKKTTNNYANYSFYIPNGVPVNELKIGYDNDGVDSRGYNRDLIVDYITYRGKQYKTTDPKTYAVGTWHYPSTRCVKATDNYDMTHLRVNRLPCNGYFIFSD